MSQPRRLATTLLAVFLLSSIARGAGPADPLFKLVPPDAGLTFSVENLKVHARSVLETRLMTGLRELPGWKALEASNEVRGLRDAVAKFESLLDAKLPAILDGLLGDAIVLTLRLPADAPPDAARGLLLVNAPDRALLDRLIDGVNSAQKQEGTLRAVSERQRGKSTYRVREFRDGRPDEFFVVLDGHLFAWSNSEDILREVIDRQNDGAPGLADQPGFQAVRKRLPSDALAMAFVDPGFASRVLAIAPRQPDPGGERIAALLGRYVSALTYAGLALEWKNGPVIHTEELVDPAKLPPSLRRWALSEGAIDPRLSHVPSTALAVANARVDTVALLEILRSLTPDAERARFDTLLSALEGLMLGQNLREEIVPRLGPGLTLVLDRPEDGRVPFVLSAQVASGPEGARVAAAIDNGLRTLLLLTSLDEKNGRVPPRLETRAVSGATVTSLAIPGSFSYAVNDGRVVIGTSAAAVARAVASQVDPKAGERFRTLHERCASGAETYALFDLNAVHQFADTRRPALAKRLAARQNREASDAGRDLDQALALIHLFDAAYFTSKADLSTRSVHRTLGLVPREPEAGP